MGLHHRPADPPPRLQFWERHDVDIPTVLVVLEFLLPKMVTRPGTTVVGFKTSYLADGSPWRVDTAQLIEAVAGKTGLTI